MNIPNKKKYNATFLCCLSLYSLAVINIVVDKQMNVTGIAISDESVLVRFNVAKTIVKAEKNSFRFFMHEHPFSKHKFFNLIITQTRA